VILSEIQSRVWERLDESAATSVRYPAATLATYCEQGQRFYIAKTGCQNNTYTITQAAYTLLYDLPCDLIQIERVLWLSGGVSYPLEALHMRDMDAGIWKWQRQTDTRARGYFALGMDRIGLWPESATAGQTYTLHYQQDVPNSLTSVPVEDHESLVNYTLARCLFSEGKVADGMKELAVFTGVVAAAKSRRASVDRSWSMGVG